MQNICEQNLIILEGSVIAVFSVEAWIFLKREHFGGPQSTFSEQMPVDLVDRQRCFDPVYLF